MAATITFTNPLGTVSYQVVPDNASFGARIKEYSTFIMEFFSDYDDFFDEAEPTNVGQIGAYVECVEDSVNIFKGTIRDKILKETDNGEQYLEITAYDLLYNISECAAVEGTESIFEATTPITSLSEVALVAGETQEDAQYPYFINTGESTWLPITGANRTAYTTLDANIDAVQTTLVFTTTYEGLLPRGYLAIVDSAGGTEYVYYDGLDDATAGNKWTARNVVRGALGSSAAAAAAATTEVSQWIHEKVHPDDPIIVEAYNNATSAWEALSTGYYEVQVEEGRIDFGFDIFSLNDGNTGTQKYDDTAHSLRFTGGFFDELAVAAVVLSDRIESVLTTSIANLGTGLVAGDINVDIDEIRITRDYNSTPKKVLAYIDDLLDAVDMSNGQALDPIGYWYNHKTEKIEVKSVSQSATPDYWYPFESEIESDVSSEYCYTACRVAYNLGSNTNLAAPTRMWHPEITDVIGGVAVSHMWYQTVEKTNADGWEKTSSGTGHQRFTEYTTDRQASTGFGINFDGNPGEVDVLWLWFDDSLNSYVLDEVSVILDPRRESVSGSEYEVEVRGVTGFNTGNPPASTATFRLNGALYIKYPEGDTSGIAQVQLKASNIGKTCEGLCIRFKGLANDGGTYRYGRIKEIEVSGNRVKTANVKLTDTTVNDSTELYDYDLYNKLVSTASKFEQYRVLDLDIGAGSYASAVSLGRLALLQAQAITIERTFIVDGEIEDIPVLGSTILLGDGNTGICTKIGYNFNSNGEKVLLISIIDFSKNILNEDII